MRPARTQLAALPKGGGVAAPRHELERRHIVGRLSDSGPEPFTGDSLELTVARGHLLSTTYGLTSCMRGHRRSANNVNNMLAESQLPTPVGDSPHG